MTTTKLTACVWKNLGLCICAFLALHTGARSQCATGHFSSRTYDTLLTGPGYGNYSISLPQWNPDSGMLISVKVNARVSVQYGFNLKNVDANASTYTLKVGREDYYTSPALGAAYDSTSERQIGVYPLSPGASVSQSPFAFMNNYDHSDSITGAVTPFLGQGRVSFAYSPVTYTTLHTSNNSSYSYQASAADQTRFSITYLYCANLVLATRVKLFTAALKGPDLAQLDWSVLNDMKDVVYEIQRSRDGETFSAIGSVQADDHGGAYRYMDTLPPGAGDSWYYRLKIEGAGSVLYTEIRSISRKTAKGFRIYPNPAVDILNIDLPAGGPWMAEVLAADGRRILGTGYTDAHTLRVSLLGGMAASGVYFVRVSDRQGHSYYSSCVLGRF